MNKVCQPSPPVRKHRRGKRTSSHETSELGAKLDDLVTLLKSTGAIPAAANRSSGHASRVDREEYTASGCPAGGEGGLCSPVTSSPSDYPVSERFGCEPVFGLAQEPGGQDAEVFLTRFRCHFVRYLPFIILSPSISAYQLRQERPFLWLANRV